MTGWRLDRHVRTVRQGHRGRHRSGGRGALGRRLVATAMFGGALTLTGVVAPLANATPGPSVVDLSRMSATDLASEIVGSGVSVSDVNYAGDPHAAGQFSDLPGVGFGSGVVLSTGLARDVLGPNRSSDDSSDLLMPGDPALDQMVSDTSHDASALSFTFVPTTNVLDFSYVFASEEYPEFANTPYNDVFAFLVNGHNCATTPDGQPVSVATINGGNPTGDPASHNPALFRDNSPDPSTGIAPIDLQADGLTVVMHCSAEVTAHEANTISLAVADVGDGAMDTSVFIKADSLHANHAPTANAVSASGRHDSPIPVNLSGSDPDSDALTYQVTTAPSHGQLSGLAPDLTYTPDAGYSGPDEFRYVVSDGSLTSDPATVSLNIAAPVPPTVDTVVSVDDQHSGDGVTAPNLRTAGPGELLLAFVSADGPRAPTQAATAVTGGGLDWSLVKRANETWGTAEVWQAFAPAASTDVTVRATLAKPGSDSSMTVVALAGGGQTVGSAVGGAGESGTASVTITPSGPGSLIWAVGHNWSSNEAPDLGAGESFVHQLDDKGAHDYFWVEKVDAPTASNDPVTVGDTGSRARRWQVVAVEIRPAA